MKLLEIKDVFEAFGQDDEPQASYRFKDDFSTQAGDRWNDDELNIVLKNVKNAELSKEEIHDRAKDLVERNDFNRTVDGILFAMNRMHILIHGIAPQGESAARAETMFKIPESMIKFAQSKGYDAFENIKKARIDLQGRPVRVKQDVATRLMSDFYKENKDSMPGDIGQHRDDIIKSIMTGLSPDESFARFTK